MYVYIGHSREIVPCVCNVHDLYHTKVEVDELYTQKNYADNGPNHSLLIEHKNNVR